MVDWPNFRIVDLSVPLMNFSHEPQSTEIVYWDHELFGRQCCRNLGVDPADLPDGMGTSSETLKVGSHAGTHLDAPYHYGPLSEGKPAKRIDEVPLEWCCGDGVVLDFHEKPAGYEIGVQDMKDALDKIDYSLKPMDIVCVRTDADKRYYKPDFFECFPGVSPEATIWLIEQGIKVTATDAWGWDVPYKFMKANYDAGKPNSLWPSHFVAREREYLHVEKLANLDQLPGSGFKISLFPIKIEKASGAWIRAVAYVPE
ncbi:MAG TPA: cyclase [Nitrospinae bacterium]|nr:cyclase [Nitrospinota bacterium]